MQRRFRAAASLRMAARGGLHAMAEKTIADVAAPAPAQAAIPDRAYQERLRRHPTVWHLRECARRRSPRFTFEVGDGGCGADVGIERNWKALDDVELVPRYGVTTSLPPIDTELFGQRFA